MYALRETVRPSADFRNSLSYEEYKKIKAGIEHLEILMEAEEDVKCGRVAPIRDTFDDLRRMLRESQA